MKDWLWRPASGLRLSFFGGWLAAASVVCAQDAPATTALGAVNGLFDRQAADPGPSLVSFAQGVAGARSPDGPSKLHALSFSPLDFGAVGDGAADDTLACQKAADRAQAVGGVLMFPAGYTFGIQGFISIRNGVRGVLGQGGRIQYLPGPQMSGFLLAGKEAGESSNVANCVVDGLHIDADGHWGVAILGQNPNTCRISNNTIVHVGKGHGISIHCFEKGQADAYGNIIANNTVLGVVDSKPPHHGIDLGSDVNCAPYSGADTFWKANFRAADATYHCVNNVVAGNRVYGGYYGVSLSAASFNAVTGNVLSSNVRNISAQNNCRGNVISGNVLQDSISSAVHLAYGSAANTICGNQIYSTRARGQGLLQAYVGSTGNKFSGNHVVIAGDASPQWHLYCGVHSSLNEFSNNTLRGAASKAYIAVESAWDNGASNPATYGYGVTVNVRGFANAGMGQVVIRGNTIEPSSAVPAIFLAQVSDASGDYPLEQLHIEGNVILNNLPSKQLELVEHRAGGLGGLTLRDNSFSVSADASKFSMPRGRGHVSVCTGNTVINDGVVAFAPGDTTPSVGIGGFFEHHDASAVKVTYYDDGMDGQEAMVRLSPFTTIVHDDNRIRLKGGQIITGSSVGGSSAILTLRRISGVWHEISRNF